MDTVYVDELATLAELNYLITQGFNFKFTYEFFDRNRDVSNERDGQERYTMGVEPFVAQFVQLEPFIVSIGSFRKTQPKIKIKQSSSFMCSFRSWSVAV